MAGMCFLVSGDFLQCFDSVNFQKRLTVLGVIMRSAKSFDERGFLATKFAITTNGVKRSMLGYCCEGKVFNSVVSPDSVFVMDDFCPFKKSSKLPFHDKTMFIDTPIFHSSGMIPTDKAHDVSSTINPDPSPKISARTRVVDDLSAIAISTHRNPTVVLFSDFGLANAAWYLQSHLSKIDEFNGGASNE